MNKIYWLNILAVFKAQGAPPAFYWLPLATIEMDADARASSVSSKFSAGATAQAINSIIKIDNTKDQEALLEVIEDFFSDSSSQQLDVDLNDSDELELSPVEPTGLQQHTLLSAQCKLSFCIKSYCMNKQQYCCSLQ